MKRPSLIRHTLRSTWRGIANEGLHRLFLGMLVLVIVGSAIVAQFEPGMNFFDGMWWSIVTLTTVGYGDISPSSLGGRMVGVVLMLLGIGLIGTLTGTLASLFFERKLRIRRGMADHDLQNHVILCEWNSHARAILEEFRADERTSDQAIALIADIEEKPVDDDLLYFVRGNVNEDTLNRAALDRADTVIILGDRKSEVSARDAKVVLATLTVETMRPDAYTIVEVSDEANAAHCRRANADEVIVTNDFNSRLISRAARDHGISQVLQELLSSKTGSDLQKQQAPADMLGKPFIDVMLAMKQQHDSMVIGIQDGLNGPVTTNPANDREVVEGDYLILVSH